MLEAEAAFDAQVTVGDVVVEGGGDLDDAVVLNVQQMPQNEQTVRVMFWAAASRLRFGAGRIRFGA